MGTPVLCTIELPLQAGRYVVSLATYDGLLDRRGEPTGNELSANQNVPLVVAVGQPNSIYATLDGVPASVAVVPEASSTLGGTATLGFTMPRCSASAQKVSVLGVDADGNFILGAGAPKPSLVSGNSALVVSTPAPSAPNLYVLTPPKRPKYVTPGLSVQLTARASPGSNSGATTAILRTTLTFSGDICGVFTEFTIPTQESNPWGITVGPDGAIWFAEFSATASKIARIPTTATVAKPQITEYATPTQGSRPYDLATGADGALWFTECAAGQIGRIPTSGSPILEFIPPSRGVPQGITAGQDGAMWFAESSANKIGRIPTSGPIVIDEYTVPTSNSVPEAITSGPDGALWFTEVNGNKIGRIPTSGAPITESPIPTAGSNPRGIAVGSNQALWFTECLGGNIGAVPLSGSPVDEYTHASTAPIGITSGPDGALWFVEANASQIGRITTDGFSITEYPIPTANSKPIDIVTGPDGSLWFTEYNGNKIGKLQ
jgi:virginiamycin B lyase